MVSFLLLSLSASCRQPLTFESQIDVLDEINNSELNDYDKHGPRPILCSYYQKEYLGQ